MVLLILAISCQTDPDWKNHALPDQRHRDLMVLSGDWDVTLSIWSDPTAAPIESPGHASLTSILDGRVLAIDMHAQLSQQAFHGLGQMGYDKLRDAYYFWWVNSTSTTPLFLTGEYDGEGRILILRGETFDPTTKTPIQVRMEVYIFDATKFTSTTYLELRDGRQLKAIEFNYTRPANLDE
ncbi:MAG: DUF1579 family protein [Acidobacteria bacterium]|nr:DUF1579 family protein [Acidobacteriota bacterium]